MLQKLRTCTLFSSQDFVNSRQKRIILLHLFFHISRRTHHLVYCTYSAESYRLTEPLRAEGTLYELSTMPSASEMTVLANAVR